MKNTCMNSICAFLILLTSLGINAQTDQIKIKDEIRAQEIKDLKFGMFICWSFSTFSGTEWTKTLDKDATYFKATGCDTDHLCKSSVSLFEDYQAAVEYENIFSINVGPNYEGRIRDIDVKTLGEVGQMIREKGKKKQN